MSNTENQSGAMPLIRDYSYDSKTGVMNGIACRNKLAELGLSFTEPLEMRPRVEIQKALVNMGFIVNAIDIIHHPSDFGVIRFRAEVQKRPKQSKNKLPQKLIDQNVPMAKSFEYCGIKISEMTMEDLQAMTVFLLANNKGAVQIAQDTVINHDDS